MLKNKNKKSIKRILNKEDIKYVIYCRKSREESSDGQKQSLLDQLNACLNYAEQRGIKIAHHNEYTDSFFRDNEYHRWVAGCDGPYEKGLLDRANGLFYVVEQQSAKIPNNRPHWSKLIKLVKKGEINGILSYAPDRHARNLVESGELVQLIDEQYLDVQYTNFTFENNENGRMILGINFVISYNYSDVLSKSIGRGKEGVNERGQADGKYKYGYIINDKKYHEPDPDFFDVRKEAFKKKIYDSETDEQIRKYIVSSGFKRKFKKDNRTSELNVKALYKIWLDPFAYGLLISGSNEIDLRDGSNPYYKPLISEEEHMMLVDRHIKTNPISLRAYNTTDEYDDIRPFPNQFIQYEGTHGLTFELPNPKRHRNALQKLQINNPKATLKDIVKPNQFRYKNNTIRIDDKQLCIDGETLINMLSQYLEKNFKIDEKNYQQYKDYQGKEYDNNMNKMNEERRKLQNQINTTNVLMERCARNFTNQNNPDELQKKVYQNDIQLLNDKIEYLELQLSRLSISQRNIIMELDGFIQAFKKLAMIYKKASYVRKRKITSLLFSNIIITAEKQVLFKAKPGLEGLFIQENGDDGIRTHV